MTRQDFLTRIINSASEEDLLYNLKKGLKEMDLEDEEGKPLNDESSVASMELIPNVPGEFPTIRIHINLTEMTIKSQGLTLRLPIECVHEFLSEMVTFHRAYHLGIQGVISQVINAITTENEKLLSETIHKGLFNRN